MHAESTFSVIIPCYNYGRFLPSALDSVLNQSRQDVEILLIDDASTDDTPEIAARYRPYVRYFRNDVNLGAGGAWRRGIENSHGRYLVKLDADDELLPGHFNAVESAFGGNPRAAMVIASVLLRDERKGGLVPEYVADEDTTLDAREFRRRLLRRFFFRMPGAALRRRALTGHEGPDAELFQVHDWEYFLRVCKGHEAAIVREPLAVYRIHEASISAISRTERRLTRDVDRWLRIAAGPGERGMVRRELDELAGSLAILMITGHGTPTSISELPGFIRTYFHATAVAARGGFRQVTRLQHSLLGKVRKAAAKRGRS